MTKTFLKQKLDFEKNSLIIGSWIDEIILGQVEAG